MNNDQGKDIRDFINSNRIKCQDVPEPDAKKLIESLRDIYQFDLMNKYIWEDLVFKEFVDYSNDNHYWESLARMVEDNFNNELYFVLTDDEFYPWPVFYCEKESVFLIIKEHAYFEFFIFDRSMNHLLFDNHQNRLLLCKR